MTARSNTSISAVQFFVDGKLVGEHKGSPPYAVEWIDDDPFEEREIVAQVADSSGNTARDSVTLKPLEVHESSSVSSVLLEPVVLDAKGHPVNGLTAADFHVFEDGVLQTIDLTVPDTIPATYTLLVDGSQSMANRYVFVREAAEELPRHLRPTDQVIVAPFTKTLGAITGPTKDHDTIAGAIDAIHAGGGTAILDCLSALGTELHKVPGRHVIVLITDGYDENSTTTFDATLAALKAQEATLYVVAVGGIAGISLKGEDLLRSLAVSTGGRAYFPSRETQLGDVHALIASDVQDRYIVSYTPTNQQIDGTWRTITVSTSNPEHVVRVRAGYQADAPPPIRPEIELTIRDEHRGYVEIGPTDLEVVEDGVEQKVQAFEEATTPVSIVLMLDASGSMRPGAAQVKEAARSFVGALPDKDSLGVLQFADAPLLVQDLSTKRKMSLDAIDQYQAIGGTALYDALIEGLARLKRVDGRRAIVVLTDGRDENNPGTAPGSVHSLADVVVAARDTGAAIYAIGLGTKVDRAVLDQLADVSGGESYFPEDVSSLEANYKRVVENLRRRYIVSYTSTNQKRDGAWRKVEIRAKQDGLVVTTKGGYFAPDKS